MKFGEAIKKTPEYRYLHRMCSREGGGHAFLLRCPDIITADVLSSFMVSDMCGADADRVFAGGYADIIKIGDGEKVLRDDIKRITDSAFITPTELSVKVYLIRGEMNESAQNKLLKILEEPPSYVRIIIGGEAKDVLPTVLSRCLKTDIMPMGEQTLFDGLTEFYMRDYRLELAAALSGGYIGIADKYMRDGGKNEKIFSESIETLKYMRTSRDILGCYARLNACGDTQAVIDCLDLILNDCMRFNESGVSYLKFKSRYKDISEIAAEYSSLVVNALAPVFLRARERLKINCVPGNVLEQLLFSLLEVKAKCKL